MELPMNLNSGGYNRLVSTTSVNVALSPTDANTPDVIIHNTDSSWLFAVSGSGTAPTAVYPVDGTATAGQLIPPNTSATFSKNLNDNFISMIRGAVSTTIVRVNVGSGV